MSDTKKFTRREFVRDAALALGAGTAATGALGAITPAEAAPAKAPKKWNRETDVVILGGGGAGLCAAIEAAGAGAKVMVLEKTPAVGGHTIISGSAVMVGGTSLQKKAGIDDSPEKCLQDSLNAGRKAYGFTKRDIAVLKTGFDKGPELIDWLMAQGVQFLEKPIVYRGTTPRVHYVAPGYRKGSPFLVDKLRSAAVRQGVDLQLRMKLLSLVTDPGGPCGKQRVIGVVVQDSKGKTISIKARKAVILATGGFANSKEMVKRYHPYLEGVRSLGSAANVGEGITAAQQVGGNLLLEFNDYGMNTLFVGTQKGYSAGLPLVEAPLIVVDKAGRRFTDETLGYVNATQKMIAGRIKVACWVFDDYSKKNFEKSFAPIVERDVVRSFPSLPELAVAMGIDAAGLQQTVKTYNADVEKGKDSEFGRTRVLKKIEASPFYAFEAEPAIYTSYSGLEINGRAQVLNELSDPIPALYAAGDVCGHMSLQVNASAGYLSGLAQAMIFGRIAGQNAAREKSWK